MSRLPILALLLLPAAAPAPAQDAGVRIYRCTDAAGRQALRDTPCPKGQAQQAREMLRPKDPAPKPARPVPPAATPPVPTPAASPPAAIYLAPPRPLYECARPDGSRYTSDDGAGNPRWVPLWTLGYPPVRRPTTLGANVGGRPPRPGQPSRPPMRDIVWPVATGGGSWIRDDCAMLPPREACARLRDRRREIQNRFFNAMPSERELLRTEERGVNARLANDCGAR